MLGSVAAFVASIHFVMLWVFVPLVLVQTLDLNFTMWTFLFLAVMNTLCVTVKTTFLCGFKATFSARMERISMLGIHMQSSRMSVVKLYST